MKLISKNVAVRLAALSFASVALSGCVYEGGLGYASDGYGYNDYNCDPYSQFDSYYDCDNSYGFYNIGFGGGWYDSYWYPGHGYFVFDNYGRRFNMRDNHRRYWGDRRQRWYRDNRGHHNGRGHDGGRGYGRGNGHDNGHNDGRGHGRNHDRGYDGTSSGGAVDSGNGNGGSWGGRGNDRDDRRGGRGDGRRGRNNGQESNNAVTQPDAQPMARPGPDRRGERGGRGNGSGQGRGYYQQPSNAGQQSSGAAEQPVARPEQPARQRNAQQTARPRADRPARQDAPDRQPD